LDRPPCSHYIQTLDILSLTMVGVNTELAIYFVSPKLNIEMPNLMVRNDEISTIGLDTIHSSIIKKARKILSLHSNMSN
jgi:hypothetical protein